MNDPAQKTRGKALIIFLVIIFGAYFIFTNQSSIKDFVAEQGEFDFSANFELPEELSDLVQDDEADQFDYGDDDIDGLDNVIEEILGSDPLSRDSDMDGFSDYEEFLNRDDPVNSEIKLSYPEIDARYQEFLNENSDPDSKVLQFLFLEQFHGLLERNRNTEAVASFLNAMAASPDPGEYENLMYELYNKESFELGLAVAVTYVASFPKLAEAYFHRGYSYQKTGDNEKAIEDYLTAIEKNTDNPYVFNNLGTIMDQQGEYEKAIGYFQEAVNMDPEEQLFQENLSKSRNMLSEGE